MRLLMRRLGPKRRRMVRVRELPVVCWVLATRQSVTRRSVSPVRAVGRLVTVRLSMRPVTGPRMGSLLSAGRSASAGSPRCSMAVLTGSLRAVMQLAVPKALAAK
ncbi:hypothetical protein [Amycolatopsis sp. NPDC003676]